MYDQQRCEAFLAASISNVKRNKREIDTLSRHLANELRVDEVPVVCVAPIGSGCHGCAFVLTDRRLIVLDLGVATTLTRDSVESVSGGAAPWHMGEGYEQVRVVTRSGRTYEGDVWSGSYDTRGFVRAVEDWMAGPVGAGAGVAPPPPPPTSAPPLAPGWYPDPASRYEYRYWDGRGWTSHVSRAGVQATDAL